MAGLACAAAGMVTSVSAEAQQPLKGRIKQSVSRWCFGGISLDDLCKEAKAMGLVGIDLLGPDEWSVPAKYGLTCTMASQIGTIPDGWNRVEHHDGLVKDSERLIPLVAAAGIRNIVSFSGNRKGMADAEGLANCVKGLKRIAALAEKHKVVVCVELLNSKRDHKDYMCDHTAWGVEMCKQVGSPNIRLLYDIYHMQIMEGDICATIKENLPYIGHVHTGGVPGRNEIDETQEIYYPRVCSTLAEASYGGFLAHEFIPRKTPPLDSLKKAIRICDV